MLDRREVSEGRFRTLVLKWLAKLPADGWEGTSHQLGDALHTFGEGHRPIAFEPTCPGRWRAGYVQTARNFLAFVHVSSTMIRLR